MRTESRFWWHWQNLKDPRWHGNSKVWWHGRAWLNMRPRGVLRIEWCIPSRTYLLEITVGGIEHQLHISFDCILFALYFSFDEWMRLGRWKAARSSRGKQIRLAVHNGAIWWRLWMNEDEWHARDPKWRDGCFHIDDWLLGKKVSHEVKQEPIPITIPMPEGVYQATVVFSEQIWRRARWPFPTILRGATIDIADHGIPVPGKGENSWDQGDSAFLSIGSSATTTWDAIADCVRVVLRERERYGGKDWRPR